MNGVGEKSALQTIMEYVAFDAQKCDLRNAVGHSLSLTKVIDSLVGVCEKWLAVKKYSENVVGII